MRSLLICGLLALCAGLALAADIVTVPTANQLKAGQIDVAAYYIDLDEPAGSAVAPRFVNYQTVYVGLTDWLELDIHRADVDRDKDSIVLVATGKLLSETPSRPDVVVGVRNLTGTTTYTNLPPPLAFVKEESDDPSFFISTAKTFFKNADKPGPPLLRLHVSYGTGDWTLMGEERHDGIFGGAQFLFVPEIGAVILHDGNDTITGLTYLPQKTPGLVLKAGTYGTHTWVGASYEHKWF